MSKKSEAFESALATLVGEHRDKGCTLDELMTGLEMQLQVLTDEQQAEDDE